MVKICPSSADGPPCPVQKYLYSIFKVLTRAMATPMIPGGPHANGGIPILVQPQQPYIPTAVSQSSTDDNNLVVWNIWTESSSELKMTRN